MGICYRTHPEAAGNGIIDRHLLIFEAYGDASFNLYNTSHAQSGYAVGLKDAAILFAE
jgi:hypothetical protein